MTSINATSAQLDSSFSITRPFTSALASASSWFGGTTAATDPENTIEHRESEYTEVGRAAEDGTGLTQSDGRAMTVKRKGGRGCCGLSYWLSSITNPMWSNISTLVTGSGGTIDPAGQSERGGHIDLWAFGTGDNEDARDRELIGSESDTEHDPGDGESRSSKLQ